MKLSRLSAGDADDRHARQTRELRPHDVSRQIVSVASSRLSEVRL
jgi:hypothetical protein